MAMPPVGQGPAKCLICDGVPVEDTKMFWRFTVIGTPRTKKNSSVLVRPGGGKLRPIPSKAWREWCRTCIITYYKYTAPVNFVIDFPVNCKAVFYRDANRGDAVGFYQGLADLLEKRGIIANDRLLVSWDGSRLDKDAKNPRVEVELTEVS